MARGYSVLIVSQFHILLSLREMFQRLTTKPKNRCGYHGTLPSNTAVEPPSFGRSVLGVSPSSQIGVTEVSWLTLLGVAWRLLSKQAASSWEATLTHFGPTCSPEAGVL